MIKPAWPANEAERLAALRGYEILDTAAEQGFDDLIAIAAAVCAMPMASVSLVDQHRQWFKARMGLAITESPREVAFCAHAILEPGQVMVVPDAREDTRFRDNPLVLGAPGIRFYAGAPLRAPGGEVLGTLCVMDDRPRELDPGQLKVLEALSRQATLLLELRRSDEALRLQLRERAWYEQRLLAQQKELELRNADLVEQTRTDPLTGLSNRRAFALHLGAALQAASLDGGALHVAVIDIDHFKGINDLHGHAEGDRVLQTVSEALAGGTGARDRIARYGGEEFVLLLPGIASDEACLRCEYLREAIARLPLALPVTVSIGLAPRRASDSPETLFARADQALYQAKRGGRNRVAVFSA